MKDMELQEMFRCIPEIDPNAGYRYFLGNMDNYKRALFSVLKSIKAKLPILGTMLRSEEYEGLRTITQTLRRMFYNIGATEVSALSDQLEVIILKEDIISQREALQDYMEQLASFLKHLELLLKNFDIMIGDENKVSFGNYDLTKTRESIKRSSDLLGRKVI